MHIEGNLARKMEFSAPGVQSRDRSWKKHYYILRGTALFVYKFDPHRFPLKVDHPIVPTTNEEECEENLHVHMPGERRVSLSTTVAPGGASPRRSSLDGPASAGAPAAPGSRRGSISAALTNIATDTGRRGSLPGPSPLSAGAGHARQSSGSSSMAAAGPSTGSPSAPNSDGKDTQLFNTPRKASVSSVSSATSQSTSIASHFQQNQLIKVYTLQNAESGLAADYVKRKNVVRVRSEGEQFLLQTDSARDVVDWIEVSLLSIRAVLQVIVADNHPRLSNRPPMSLLTWMTAQCQRSLRCPDDVAAVSPHRAQPPLQRELPHQPLMPHHPELRIHPKATLLPLLLPRPPRATESVCSPKISLGRPSAPDLVLLPPRARDDRRSPKMRRSNV